MIYLYAYLISCIPALLFGLMTVWEDIQCLRGKKNPGHKFGYNWKWPWTNSFTPFVVLLMMVPVLNLYTGWFIVSGIIIMSITDWFKK